MLMVGLTGGIGSGKSAVAARLAALGAVILDADRIAREVVAPGTDGLAEIVAAFGERVLGPDGALDRAALGAVVFTDAAARRRLEEITHPRVRARTAQLAAAARPDAVVVNDVPLLVEVGLAPTYHLVVVVETEVALRMERLVRDRGMSVEEARRRIAAQTDDARRRAAADVVVPNNAGLTDLHRAVDALWRDRLVPYERNLRERRAVPAERAVLAPPDPTWPEQFERLAARLRHGVGDTVPRIDHVGPTAVPGLAAPDVIDIQVAVPSLAHADALADRLAAAGFPPRTGQWWDTCDAERSERRLHGGADPGRPAELHVRVEGSPAWRCALLLRDYLRADADGRAAYEEFARTLADRHPDADAAWFGRERARIERWAVETGWRP